MSEQDNSAKIEGQEANRSGLLLSVEPLASGERLHAQSADKTDTDTDLQDTGDASGDADGSDESDADGTDMTEGDETDGGKDTDGSDSVSIDTDGGDASRDADGSDAT